MKHIKQEADPSVDAIVATISGNAGLFVFDEANNTWVMKALHHDTPCPIQHSPFG